MIILTLDPNISYTGYLLYDSNSGIVITTGTIKTPIKNNISIEDRMLTQRTKLEAILGTYSPVDLIIVEDIFHGPNPSTAIILGLLTGILIGGICKDFNRMPNTTWWKRVTGSGKKDYNSSIPEAWKNSVCFQKTKAFLKHEPETEHEMDATSILLAYLNGGKHVKLKRVRKR